MHVGEGAVSCFTSKVCKDCKHNYSRVDDFLQATEYAIVERLQKTGQCHTMP